MREKIKQHLDDPDHSCSICFNRTEEEKIIVTTCGHIL